LFSKSIHKITATNAMCFQQDTTISDCLQTVIKSTEITLNFVLVKYNYCLGACSNWFYSTIGSAVSRVISAVVYLVKHADAVMFW